MFQATKTGWRRFAARLLLVPALAGGAASLAIAQPPRPGPGMMPAAGGDPKAMLKDGRKALDEGRFNDARDLAQRAEASNPNGKWGLFDDTPNALRRDIDAGQARAKEAEVHNLTKQAKALFTKSAAGEAEKAHYLDQALPLARRASQLHGPNYSVWEFGERPDRLVKDIETARSKLKIPAVPPAAPPAMAAGNKAGTPVAAGNKAGSPPPGGSFRPAVATTTPGAPSGVTTAAGTGAGPAPATTAIATAPAGSGPLAPTGPVAPAGPLAVGPLTTGPLTAGPAAPTGPVSPAAPGTPATDAKKATAQRLMADGKRLADGGEFAGAHAKYTAANQVGAEFSATEPNPGLALLDLNARGAAAIDRLVREAAAQTNRKDFGRAEAALDAAAEIATALSLFARPIEEAKSALRLASNGANGGVPPGGLAPAGGPEALVRATDPRPGGPVAPAGPTAQAPVNPAPAAPAQPGGAVTGRQLIDQATVAFRQGDFEAARRIALQAHNAGGVQPEARGLLNQIDAEVFSAKQREAVRSLDAAAGAVQNKDHGQALGVLVLIDPNLLSAEQQARRAGMINACKAELDRAGMGVVAAGGTQPPAGDAPPAANPMNPGANPPGVARIQPDATKGGPPESLAGQAEAMRRVAFQKLRSDGLKVQADAQAAFGRGETELAIQMLTDYTTQVRAASLEPASTALLLRPVDSRLEMFKVMRGQVDAIARERTDRREARDLVSGRGAADEQRKAEVKRLVQQYHALVQRSDFAAAERVAMQAKQLEPD
ncbi:MAG TPA: hypothetical protein VH092_12115, partial [Urbifossiella sp.]|nr:hypothetical protein [Urbifossiella sp.]